MPSEAFEKIRVRDTLIGVLAENLGDPRQYNPGRFMLALGELARDHSEDLAAAGVIEQTVYTLMSEGPEVQGPGMMTTLFIYQVAPHDSLVSELGKALFEDFFSHVDRRRHVFQRARSQAAKLDAVLGGGRHLDVGRGNMPEPMSPETFRARFKEKPGFTG